MPTASTRPTRALRPIATFVIASFAWNFALGTTYVSIPLYAASLGFSGVAIGSLVSLPIILQIAITMIGGAYTDRIGGRALTMIACVFTVAAGIVFAYSATMTGLMVAQVLWIVSRAVFWPASWALATDLPGDRNRQLGHLNAVSSIAQIAGTAAAGIIVEGWGYQAGFWMFAVLGVVSWIAIALFPQVRRTGVVRKALFDTYRKLLRMPVMYFGICCAYISALPFSLSFSFYPILLTHVGYSAEATGWLMSVRGLGAALAGVVAGAYIRRTTDFRWPLAAALSVGLSVILVAVFTGAAPVAAFLFCVGLGSGIMTLYFQILMSEISTPEERGSAMALGGLGWSLSHLTTPLVMGAMSDAIGIINAFYAIGVFAIAWGIGLSGAHRRLHPDR